MMYGRKIIAAIGGRYRHLSQILIDIMVIAYICALPLIFIVPVLAPALIIPLLGLVFRQKPHQHLPD